MDTPRAEEDRIAIAADHLTAKLRENDPAAPGGTIRLVEAMLSEFHRHFLVDIKQVGDLATVAIICQTPEGKVLIDDFARMLDQTRPEDMPGSHRRVDEVMHTQTGPVSS